MKWQETSEVERIIRKRARMPTLLPPEVVAMIYISGNDHTNKPYFVK